MGIAWIYLVEDMVSRACLAASIGHRLSQERAASAIQEGHRALTGHGITEPLVISLTDTLHPSTVLTHSRPKRIRDLPDMLA